MSRVVSRASPVVRRASPVVCRASRARAVRVARARGRQSAVARDERLGDLSDDALAFEADKTLKTTRDARTGSLRAIVFSTTAGVDVREVERLSAAVGWPERPREKIKRALENSFMVATLYECDIDELTGNVQETSRGRLIACARATSDHVFNATLWDIMVDPEYQGLGYGKALVQQMIRVVLSRDVANVTLFADQDVIPFYRALGFVADPEGIRGMFLYDSE